MPAPHTLTLFDLDNGLAEGSEEHIRPAYYNYMYTVINAIRPQGSFEEFMGQMNVLNRKGLGSYGWAAHLGLPPSWAEEQHHLMGPVLAQAVGNNLKPNPQVVKLLTKLKEQGHHLAIYTHGHASYANAVVGHIGLSSFFPAHDIFDITTNNGTLKTSVASYRYVVSTLQQRLGTTFARCNMVEDNATNLVAAKQAGFTTYLIGSEFLPEDPTTVDSHHPTLIATLEDLLNS